MTAPMVILSEDVPEGTIYLVPPDIIQEIQAIALGQAFGLDMSKREEALNQAIEDRKGEFGIITAICKEEA